MTNFSIRNLPKEVYEKLKKKAKKNKRSLNNEMVLSLMDSVSNIESSGEHSLEKLINNILKTRKVVKSKNYIDPVKLIREMRDGE